RHTRFSRDWSSDVCSSDLTVFRQEELDQMMAPLALYPDALLAQVLMASTYPGDVADAVAWSKANPKASGDDAVRQVADKPWDTRSEERHVGTEGRARRWRE